MKGRLGDFSHSVLFSPSTNTYDVHFFCPGRADLKQKKRTARRPPKKNQADAARKTQSFLASGSARSSFHEGGFPGQRAWDRWFNLFQSRLRALINSFSMLTSFYFSHVLETVWFPEGKSFGISWVTLPVAAHSAPRCRVVMNPAHSME